MGLARPAMRRLCRGALAYGVAPALACGVAPALAFARLAIDRALLFFGGEHGEASRLGAVLGLRGLLEQQGGTPPVYGCADM
jgi:hypothetical protein